MVIEKIKIAIEFLHNIFYGQYWFIPWGFILLIFAIKFGKDIPKLIKSIKNKNKGR